jgi:hypothetical protein
LFADPAAERSLALEAEAKAVLREQERRMAAMAARQPKAASARAARAFQPWWSPWLGPPMPGQQSRDWHGHSNVWTGRQWEPVTATLILDLIDARGVATDQSLSGHGRPTAPLSVELVDGTAY